MRPYTIIGYTFQAENVCPECLIEGLIKNGSLSPAARDMLPEEALDQAWEAQALFDMPEGASRGDESTFDSSEFPKVIFPWQSHFQEECGGCGKLLILDRDKSRDLSMYRMPV